MSEVPVILPNMAQHNSLRNRICPVLHIEDALIWVFSWEFCKYLPDLWWEMGSETSPTVTGVHGVVGSKLSLQISIYIFRSRGSTTGFRLDKRKPVEMLLPHRRFRSIAWNSKLRPEKNGCLDSFVFLFCCPKRCSYLFLFFLSGVV